ncbi:hypothetical protein Tco_0042180 [Tanacetum coccineum]
MIPATRSTRSPYQPKGAAAATLGCVWPAAAAIRERLAVRQPWGAIGLCFRRIRVRLAVRQPWGAAGLCHLTRKGCLAVGTAMGPFGSRVCTTGYVGLGITAEGLGLVGLAAPRGAVGLVVRRKGAFILGGSHPIRVRLA